MKPVADDLASASRSRRVSSTRFLPGLLFLLALLFYVLTLLPSMGWGDGIKLQSEAIAGESFVLAELSPREFAPDPLPFSRVGVAAWDHPLYIILGHLVVRAAPFADPLWLVNLLSAVFGAACIALLFVCCRRLTGSAGIALFASVALAVSHTFWWHSSTPEVYTLLLFLLLASYSLFDQYERSSRAPDLIWSAFFWGLAASTHVLAFLAVPALGLYAITSRRTIPPVRWQPLAQVGLGFLGGFSVYLIQFIRMTANFGLDEILGPVVGSTFLSRLGTISPLALAESVLSYLFFLTVQFSLIGLALGWIGARTALREADPALRKAFAFFCVYATFGVFYRVTDQFTFFLPSYVFWAMLMAAGVREAVKGRSERTRTLFAGLLAALLVFTPLFYQALPGLAARAGVDDAALGIPRIGVGLRNGLAYYMNPNKRGDYGAYVFGTETVSALLPDSVVIAEWYTDTDEYFILRYLTQIHPVRPDVTVIGWPARDPFSFDASLASGVIEQNLPEHPVYLASLSEKFYGASRLVERYCIVPEANLFRLYSRESRDQACLGRAEVTE